MTPKLLNDDLKIDINAKGTYTNKNSVDQGALGNALSMDPTKPVYDSSPNNIFGGYYQELDPATNAVLGTWNPAALLQQRRRPERALRFLGNVEFDYKLPFLKDLHAVVNLGIDATDAKVMEYLKENSLGSYTLNPSVINQYFFNTGETAFEKQTNTNTTMDTYLTYSKSMTGFVNKFDAQAGYSYQNFINDGNYRSYQNNATTGVREVIVDENNPTGRYYNPINLQAFFARANVDMLGKYLFTATLRADASSLFTPENRWGYFPAFGAAWKLKEESFLKNSKWVQDLKLRAGWGKTGQANIPGYFFPSQLLFQPGNTTSQYLPNQTVYTPLSYNPDLTWEKTTTVNLGLDFEVFKNGILSGSIDVYSRKTTDLLATVTFPAGGTVSGEFIKNIGSTEGNGFETTLNIKAITTDNFSLNFGMNITYNYSKVSELGERTEVTVADTNVDAQTPLEYHHVGNQPFSAWVFEQVYNANGDPVVGAFVDRNGDGQITSKDRYYVAMVPNWTYGFSTNVSYKNWDLSASFRGQLGGQVYNANKKDRGTLQSAISLNGNAVYNVLEEVNPLINDYKSVVLSDYLLEDATFLRCDNISLSYKLPKFIKKSKLRISGSVNNPFIITDYSGQDPENFGGIDGSLYPRPTTYTLGLSLDF
jgi:iron complex outermembrane receptor protein